RPGGIQGVVPFGCEGRPSVVSRVLFPSVVKEDLVWKTWWGIQGVAIPFGCEGRPAELGAVESLGGLHMRAECPELKKKLIKEKFTFKKAMAMMATWSDEYKDENSQATSGDDEVHCLMARSDDSNEVKHLKKIHKRMNLKLKPLKQSLLRHNLLNCKINPDLQQSQMSGLPRSLLSPSSFQKTSPHPSFPKTLFSRARAQGLCSLGFLLTCLSHLFAALFSPNPIPTMAPKAKKLVSRHRPRSSTDGDDSRAPTEHRTKHREDRLPELIIPPGLDFLPPDGTSTRLSTTGVLHTTVRETSFLVTPNLLSTTLQIPNSGLHVLKHHPDEYECHQLITLQPYDPTNRKSLNANNFPPLHRVIHHIFTTMIVPKDGSRELVTAIQKSSFHAFLNHGVVTRELKGKGPSTAIEVDDDFDEGEEDEADNADEDSQPEPQDAPEDEDNVSPSSPASTEPSIRELLAQMQLQITTGFDRIHTRLDTIDSGIAALADTQVQLQLRLTRMSIEYHELRRASAPPGDAADV
ncbi:hypothetical protein Taro_046607, partial [Colocasia esculenta]|nr:hypothetical protein [Colocasia esculenta]